MCRCRAQRGSSAVGVADRRPDSGELGQQLDWAQKSQDASSPRASPVAVSSSSSSSVDTPGPTVHTGILTTISPGRPSLDMWTPLRGTGWGVHTVGAVVEALPTHPVRLRGDQPRLAARSMVFDDASYPARRRLTRASSTEICPSSVHSVRRSAFRPARTALRCRRTQP